MFPFIHALLLLLVGSEGLEQVCLPALVLLLLAGQPVAPLLQFMLPQATLLEFLVLLLKAAVLVIEPPDYFQVVLALRGRRGGVGEGLDVFAKAPFDLQVDAHHLLLHIKDLFLQTLVVGKQADQLLLYASDFLLEGGVIDLQGFAVRTAFAQTGSRLVVA
jgi:hypothetical protein